MSEAGIQLKNELTAKNLASDEEVRWCPGCGDYAILKRYKRRSLASASLEKISYSCRVSAARHAFRIT